MPALDRITSEGGNAGPGYGKYALIVVVFARVAISRAALSRRLPMIDTSVRRETGPRPGGRSRLVPPIPGTARSVGGRAGNPSICFQRS
jgi:hypothetical protein